MKNTFITIISLFIINSTSFCQNITITKVIKIHAAIDKGSKDGIKVGQIYDVKREVFNTWIFITKVKVIAVDKEKSAIKCLEPNKQLYIGDCLFVGKGKSVYGLYQKFYLIGGFTTNIPKQFLGFFFCNIKPKNIGFYIDVKTGLPIRGGYEDEDFYDNISVNKAENIFNDELLKKDDNWLSINIGITKILMEYVSLYFGGGIAVFSAFRQYYDTFEILGTYGKYWIEDKSKSSIRPNILSGLIIVVDPNWFLQIGGEIQPPGVTIGLGYSF